ncbi:MAG: hypothetical protein AUJ55_07575 [Proteobacteria bacterium CG1_02_64_396]|nr:MAG: hypothetical protein AUJ55_07575 [Proteobacteria bacterium CG1_02_64_396]
MMCSIQNSRSRHPVVKVMLAGLCCLWALGASAAERLWLVADEGHDTLGGLQWDGSPRDDSRRAGGRSDDHGIEKSFQLQYGRMTYSERLPVGIWHPSRALTSRADLDWGGSRIDLSGFWGPTRFRWTFGAQYQKSQQGLEQWWDGDLLYQKNQLEFQAVQLEGGFGWPWDYQRLSGQFMAEVVGRQEDQSRSFAAGQSAFSVERIRSAWVGFKGDVRLPLTEGIALTAGGNWDYSPWNQMTNTIFLSSPDATFQGAEGTRWQAWAGFLATGRFALGPFHLALVVGMSQTRLNGETSGRTVADSTGNLVTAYWPENQHREYGVGMTLTWSPGR